jgi:hypothetical protein
VAPYVCMPDRTEEVIPMIAFVPLALMTLLAVLAPFSGTDSRPGYTSLPRRG